jgi:hypothetical protein
MRVRYILVVLVNAGISSRSVLDGVLVKEYDPDEGLDVTEMLRIALELQIERAEADETNDDWVDE